MRRGGVAHRRAKREHQKHALTCDPPTTPPSDTQGTVPCFDCGADTRKKWGEQTFTYGAGPDAAELRVTLPIHVCPSCGFECLDDEAEDPEARKQSAPTSACCRRRRYAESAMRTTCPEPTSQDSPASAKRR